MPLDARLEAWARIALAQVPTAALAPLLRTFGSAHALLRANRAQVAAASSSAIADRLAAPLEGGLLEGIRKWLREPGHELIAWDDADYPKALLETGEGPPALYFMGRRDLLNRPALAIVGSRHATAQGCENARAFAEALSRAGLTIVSGLALGADAAAHEGALRGAGSTIACIGTGPERVYPSRHRELAHVIALSGAVVSEFPPGTPPLRQNFPRRNRLISGLARGVLVVEATLQSGSLITARLAGDQGREVFAIPGSIHSPFAKGCHKLIREGAKLVETAQDVLDELKIPGLAAMSAPQAAGDAPPRSALIEALGGDPCDLDTLIARTRIGPDALSAALVELELEGHVAALPGGKWQRVA
jgi:DNA processing protein